MALLRHALSQLDNDLPAHAPTEESPETEVLGEAARRMRDNHPYASPLYAGQMLKPPHPVARAAYAMAMAVNPNNHALDGGRASSAMEIEAVAGIAAMFGFGRESAPFLGHLTSGGTFANLEALWVAGQTTEKRTVVASDQAHYTHQRISAVLGLPFTPIRTDPDGRMSINHLEDTLQGGGVGTVVATLGTTATGAVDPLDRILRLREKYHFRLHVDAAYGGYFKLAGNLAAETKASFDAVEQADSIVVDPHKHGLQPYGCGCVLFADAALARLYKHDSPYTYFTSSDLHLGELTLECSRAGAAAVALWTTQKLLPLESGGQFAEGIGRCRAAALQFFGLLRSSPFFVLPSCAPQLDIVVWTCVGRTVQQSSARSQNLFRQAAQIGLHLAVAQLPVTLFPAGTWEEGQTVTCLRSVIMKWDHLEWIERIFEFTTRAAEEFVTI